MNLPDENRCYELWDHYRMPAHVREHSRKVALVARFVAEKLSDKGVCVDVDLVERAALLHDLLKAIEFAPDGLDDAGISRGETVIKAEDRGFFIELMQKFDGMPHTIATYELLKDDYPELALVIRKHGYKDILEPSLQPFTWEEKILTYADKRVAHEEIVSLEERFREGHERYKKRHPEKAEEEDTERYDRAYYAIEDELFQRIGMSPDSVKTVV